MLFPLHHEICIPVVLVAKRKIKEAAVAGSRVTM
jgi:hypothetical protein